MSDLTDVHEGLVGSPYSLPDDPSQREVLQQVFARASDLEERCVAVRQSLAKEFNQRLHQATRTTEIYESNAIEGKTATLRETREILDARNMWDTTQALARYTLRAALREDPKVHDVVGLAAARILVDEYIGDKSRPLSEVDLREIHSLLLRGEPSAGQYKQYINRIQGSAHTPVPPVDVPGAMYGLVSWLGESHMPLVWRSAVAHAWLTHIHPFDDGNGRLARLLANYVLGRGSYPPLIVRSTSDRPRYLAALGHSDQAGDISPLVRLFLRVLRRGVELMEKPDFAWKLFQADLLVREESIYRRWQSTVGRFFDEVAAHLILSGKQLNVIGEVSPSDYELLCRRDATGNAWYAKVFARDQVVDLLIWIGFTSSQLQRHLELDQSYPSFFISVRDTNPRAVRPYRKVTQDQDQLYDELCLIADEDRALFRRGDVTRRPNVSNAAELYAALLSGYLDDWSS